MVRTFGIVAVLAVLTLALSLVALRSAAPGDGSAQVRFMREMIQHHSQAIDMAIRIRDRSADADLRAVALDMTLAQQDQIGQMRGWMTQWNVKWAGQAMTAQHAREMGMATPQDVAGLSERPVADAERDFLRLMIRHHQGALTMTRDFLEQDLPAPAEALARQIAAAQGSEIRLMTDLLRERGGQPDPAPAGHDDAHGGAHDDAHDGGTH